MCLLFLFNLFLTLFDLIKRCCQPSRRHTTVPLTGLFHSCIFTALFLVELDWQSVGVLKEEEPAVGIFVRPDCLVRNGETVQLVHRCIDVVDLEGQMAQPRGFGACRPQWWRGKREQLDDVILAQGQVGLVRLPFGAVVLGEDAQAEDTCVELEAPPIVGADDGNVMYFVQLQHCFLW